MRLWPWKRREPILTEEAAEAVDAAEQSNHQADMDLRRAQVRQSEAARVAARLRQHNTANNYDDWIRTIARGGP